MGDQAQAAETNVERGSSGEGNTIIPEGLKRFGRNLWTRTEEVAGNVTETVREKGGQVIDDIQSGELLEKGKVLARDGANIYQGQQSTGNEAADQAISIARDLNPLGGLTDRAVDIGEKAVNGESITGDDIRGVATEAGKSFILPVPDRFRDLQRLQEISERTGISDQVREAVTNASEAGGESEAESETITTGEADEEKGLPRVDIQEGGKKVIRFFRNLGRKE